MTTDFQEKIYPHWYPRGDIGGNLMCDDPGKDILEAKERLVAIFGDLEIYMEFMMQKQERTDKARREIRRFLTLP